MGVNLPNTDWNPVVRIVEDDFDKSGDDALSSSLMKQRLSLLLTHVTELIRQHKLYRWNKSHNILSSMPQNSVFTPVTQHGLKQKHYVLNDATKPPNIL